MIENFKKEIRKNSSEFRMMHDLDSIKQDFKENLYKINYKESINKIRDISNVEVNKCEIQRPAAWESLGWGPAGCFSRFSR